MRRIRLPSFVLEVVEDPRQRGILLAGGLAVFAVGLVPRTLAPGLPEVQSAIRARPEVESVLLLMAFASAAAVVAGGALADIWRRRELLLAALVVMAVAMLSCVLVDHGPVYYVLQIGSVLAAGVALTFSIGSVAVAYAGVPRATALGAVYAAYGAATACATPLLLLFGPFGPRSQAFLVAAIAGLVAIWAAHRWMPALAGSLPAPRPAVVDVALWGIAVLAVVTGLLGFGAPGERLVNVILIGGGALGLAALSVRWRRDREALGGLRLERRAMGAALAVGVVVGFSQMIPLLLLPAIFTYILRYGSLWATIAIAPFAIALFVAGPVSGLLLQRFGPRTIVLGGTTTLALGNLGLAAALDRFGIETAYAWFIVPLALIGAGFVVATTVRTAIVFAATPSGLPASAAGYNEASVGLGSRVGTIAATLVVTSVSLDWLRQHLAGAPDASATVEQFRSILLALGLPGFGDLIAGASLQDRVAFASAYLVGVDVTLLVSGLLGVAGAVLAWFLIGRRDPLRTVFEMQEERDGPAAPHPSSREGAPSA